MLLVLLGGCVLDSRDSDTSAGDADSGSQVCEMCGDLPCNPATDGCFSEAFCVPPADAACLSCMMANCADSVEAQCGAFNCVDYAQTIGGCGDATPYADVHYECMASSCDAECHPGEGFTACACI